MRLALPPVRTRPVRPAADGITIWRSDTVDPSPKTESTFPDFVDPPMAVSVVLPSPAPMMSTGLVAGFAVVYV